MCRPNRRSAPHFFHKKCFHSSGSNSGPAALSAVGVLQSPPSNNKKMCPHCESTDQPLTVQLKLTTNHVPVQLLQSVSKMTFPKSNLKKSDLILKHDKSINYKMANGKIISSEGMPEGIEAKVLGNILEKLEDKQTSK